MYDIILAFITAFALTYYAIPSIIRIARIKHLFDEPGERRSHSVATPSLGGIGIFAGVIFSILLWTPFTIFSELQYILCAFVIIFLIGAKDDIDPISPYKKMWGELFAATILVYKANIRLTSLYGLFGVHDIPEWASIPLSIFTIIVIINAFNLIDGINGLSGSIAILISLTLGTWFFMVDRIDLAIIAFALIGATLAFLNYNVTPAKIFMGDTGALLLGLICAILAISFIEYNKELAEVGHPRAVASVPAVAFGILILPLFDTLRVFTTRILKKKSPFHPDRTHIHHLLIDSGLTHMQATSILVAVNAAFIVLVYYLQRMGTLNLLILVLVLATFLSTGLYMSVQRKKDKAAR
jgi:UDP-GlcNAc:undecaprenyl-phosphate GlcNAc-1-phosphate transferase